MSSVTDRRRGLSQTPELWAGTGWQLYVWNTDQWVKYGTPSYTSEGEVRDQIRNAVEDGDAPTPIGYAPAARRIIGPTNIYQPTALWIVRDNRWVWVSEQNMWKSDARQNIEAAVRRGEAPFMAYEGPGHPGALVVYDGRKWSLLYRT